MKKLVAILLCITTLTGLMTGLTGCSTSDSTNLTKAEWISMVNVAFGMNSYTSEEPYYSNVNAKSEYFEDTQIAYEWNVLPANEKYEPKATATKEFVLVTLINAGEFCDFESSNDEKIECAVENGFIEDNAMLKVSLNKPVDYEEAQELLEQAQTAWAEKSFEHVIEEVAFFDTIKDYSDSETTPIKEYVVEGNKTYIPMTEGVEIAEGDIYVLPANATNLGISSYKAEKIEIEGGYIVITNASDDVEIEDCIQELQVEETYEPDLLASGSIVDGNGNIIPVSSGTEEYAITPLVYSSDSSCSVQQLGKGGNAAIGFKKGDWEVSGSVNSKEVSFTVKKKLNESMKSFFEVSISHIKVTNDIDYSWGKLHSATSKVDYEVKVSGGVEGDFYKNEYVLAPWHSNEVNKFLKNMKTAIYGGWKDKNAPGTATINICSIPVASAGIITLNLDIKVKLSVEGTFALEVTIDGSKGVQYKNGNVRYIKTNDLDINVKANAKAEATPSLGLNAKVLGKAVIGVAVDGGVGMEIEAVLHLIDTENHLLDTSSSSVPADIIEATVENGGTTTVEEIQKIAEEQGGTYSSITSGDVKLDIDLCFNVKIYPVLRIGLEEDTVAGKLLKGSNVKLSYEWFGSDDAWLDMHIESFSDLSSWERIKACNGKECTKEFEPFESVEDVEVEQELQEEKDKYESDRLLEEGIVDKEQLDISVYSVTVGIGEEQTIEVTKVPDGYQLSEVTCYSENEAVAKIDKNGVITGIDTGSTIIVVETTDKKFKITCAVTVTSDNSITITPLTCL